MSGKTSSNRPLAAGGGWHYFSIIQRKVLKPNDYTSLEELEHALRAFARRYSAQDKPFTWCFTRQDLQRRLRDPPTST
jgi:hypothetical protein